MAAFLLTMWAILMAQFISLCLFLSTRINGMQFCAKLFNILDNSKNMDYRYLRRSFISTDSRIRNICIEVLSAI